jgi:predicted RNA polymerase sigma factor
LVLKGRSGDRAAIVGRLAVHHGQIAARRDERVEIDQPGAGHAGRAHLAGEAIRLARQLTLATQEPEARGLLALMLLNHARLPARLDREGRIVTLDRQDRHRWDTREIAEGVRVLQSALAVQSEARRPGRYQIEAAIAALHDDAAYAAAAHRATNVAERDHLVRQAADARAARERPGPQIG